MTDYSKIYGKYQFWIPFSRDDDFYYIVLFLCYNSKIKVSDKKIVKSILRFGKDNDKISINQYRLIISKVEQYRHLLEKNHSQFLKNMIF